MFWLYGKLGKHPPTNWDDLFNFYKQGLFSATIDCSNTYSKKVFLCSDHSVMPVFRNTISLSNATVFIESNSPFLKTALQHMPFGPSHCCALNKGADHKRAVSISEPQKGSETKERETYRESGTTASSAPQERIVGSSAVKARLTWSTGILKTKGLYCASARANCERL